MIINLILAARLILPRLNVSRPFCRHLSNPPQFVEKKKEKKKWDKIAL